jgi:lipopolysaccharide export system permease protein
MLTILDRYIIRKFLGTYLFAIALILAITVMFDINEKIDAFIKAPLHATIFDYFLNFLPYFANQFSPLFTFIAVIFFTSKMAGNSEIIAILSSGMSYRRMMRPYMISAAIIAIVTFLLAAYVIPPANVKRIAFTNTYVRDKSVNSSSNVQMQVSPGVVAYIGDYNTFNNHGSRFSLDKFEGKRLCSRLTARELEWKGGYSWTVIDYTIRDFGEKREIIKNGARLDTVIPLEPADFVISKTDQETLTTPELARYVKKQRSRGVSSVKQFEIEYHRRFAACAAAFILTIIGVSLSSRKVKGGMGMNIGIGLVLSFTYIIFMTLTQSFAINGMTSPLVAMWIPNLVYSLIALYLYFRASRG